MKTNTPKQKKQIEKFSQKKQKKSPMMNYRDMVGNRKMQVLFRQPTHSKLKITQPDDPSEIEADKIADEANTLNTNPQNDLKYNHKKLTITKPASNTFFLKSSNQKIENIPNEKNSGKPLEQNTKSMMEAKFDEDFSNVRIHEYAKANKMADSIGAKAFTKGNDIFLNSSEKPTNSKLMLHEITHVIQQRGQNSTNTIQRKPLDPTNKAVWKQLSKEPIREALPGTFEETLSAATGTFAGISEEMENEGVPKTEEEEVRFENQVKTLVKMAALGLMASHRATIEMRRDENLKTGAITDDEQKRQESAVNEIRIAANQLRLLNELKSELEGFRNGLDVVEANSLTSLFIWTDTWATAISENSSKYRSEEITQYIITAANAIKGPKKNAEFRMLVYFMTERLSDWRQKQIDGVDSAIYYLYDTFPLFAQLGYDKAADKDLSTSELLDKVVDAYNTIIENIDDAIVQIGTEDIHPFDLPEAVNAAKTFLPSIFQAKIDKLVFDREVVKFWTNLSLTAFETAVVFVPVVGPAIAALVGLASTATGLEEMLDRVKLTAASTNPEGTMLGVSGPSSLEIAMMALEIILTAADLHGVAKDIGKTNQSFENVLDTEVDVDFNSSKTRLVQEEMGDFANDAQFLSHSRKTGSKDLSILEAEHELELAKKQGIGRSLDDPEYEHEIMFNNHTWKKHRGTDHWCRFSDNALCFIFGEGGGYHIEEVEGLLPNAFTEGKKTPRGQWEGTPGNSLFTPGEKHNEIWRLTDFEGMHYQDGYPDFTPFVRKDETVIITIEDFLGKSRDDHFKIADETLAKRNDWLKADGTPNRSRAIAYRKGAYTWHHVENSTILQLVPMELHKFFTHAGGMATSP